MANYYPPVAFSFSVNFAGNRSEIDSGFQEVSGLEAEREVSEVREGGENRFAHRLPGRIGYRNIALKRGIVLASSPLFQWCKDTMESDLAKRIQVKDLTVSLLDQNHAAVMSWSVLRAWPVKWSVDRFSAQENAVAVETIELSFQRVERKQDRQLAASGFLQP